MADNRPYPLPSVDGSHQAFYSAYPPPPTAPPATAGPSQPIMPSSNRRGPWSHTEDDNLRNLVHAIGASHWVRISEGMVCRTPKQCRERWHQNLKPALNHLPITEEEGRQIEELVQRHGKRWAEIARQLVGRSDNAVKNWWNGGVNRRKRADGSRRVSRPSLSQTDNLPRQSLVENQLAPLRGVNAQLPLPAFAPGMHSQHGPSQHNPQPFHYVASPQWSALPPRSYSDRRNYPQQPHPLNIEPSYHRRAPSSTALPSPGQNSNASLDTAPSLVSDRTPHASPPIRNDATPPNGVPDHRHTLDMHQVSPKTVEYSHFDHPAAHHGYYQSPHEERLRYSSSSAQQSGSYAVSPPYMHNSSFAKPSLPNLSRPVHPDNSHLIDPDLAQNRQLPALEPQLQHGHATASAAFTSSQGSLPSLFRGNSDQLPPTPTGPNQHGSSPIPSPNKLKMDIKTLTS